MWIVSEGEVLSAIRYLDPDLPDGSKVDGYRAALRIKRRLRIGLAIASIVALCAIFARYLFDLAHSLP